ncbi:multicopper oxidase family protein [Streptomyces sp. AK02-01A]|uniref:multicopper oxidase family protein n=1 Tax=Streptomyces sp. AK02-01A TaxID=3028648 RepID=UPI0029B4FF26|nr:multicopper oxidase family protein [Streptomyces sp. AK02-01A]MDX3853149.1 multicopper oxidase family protein [Streptomyces sp. AK02-01A]
MFEPLFIIDLTITLLTLVTALMAGRRAGRLARATDDGAAQATRRLRRALYGTVALTALRLVVAGLLLTGGWNLASNRLVVVLPPAVLGLAWAVTAERRNARHGTVGLAPAVHTGVAGVLLSAYWLLVPSGPGDTPASVLISVAVLAAVAAGSTVLARLRAARTGYGAVHAPWLALGLVLALGSVSFLGYQGSLSRPAGHQAGPMDWGGGAVPAQNSAADAHQGHGAQHTGHDSSGGSAGTRDVEDLTGPRARTPDVRYTLTAAHRTVKLASGTTVDALTFNGTSPGPELRVRQGELLEVTLVNKDVKEGVTVHWHGVDVPNAEDGVPGVTQDAVVPGGRHVYRFVPDRAGTFWYHTHRDAAQTVKRGLFGALVVEPPADATPAGSASSGQQPYERVVFTHLWPGKGTQDLVPAFDAADTVRSTSVAPGRPVRLRLINSSDEPQRILLGGAPFTVVAIDGNALNRPAALKARTDLLLPAGGRLDVAFTMGREDFSLRLDGAETPNRAGLALNPGPSKAPAELSRGTLFDPLAYGEPTSGQPAGTDRADRRFEMVFDNGFGFFDGGFTFANTINGRLYPNVPTLMVTEGDTVRMRITNRSIMDHPVHLHGHRVRVLSRNGDAVTGSPWYTDTLNVAPGEVFEIVFSADNPGIWMDHCHNQEHAAAGMVMHLAYTGITSDLHGNGHSPE